MERKGSAGCGGEKREDGNEERRKPGREEWRGGVLGSGREVSVARSLIWVGLGGEMLMISGTTERCVCGCLILGDDVLD